MDFSKTGLKNKKNWRDFVEKYLENKRKKAHLKISEIKNNSTFCFSMLRYFKSYFFSSLHFTFVLEASKN